MNYGLAKVIIREDCEKCLECVELCPFDALGLVEGKVKQVGPCMLCGGCKGLCDAIELIPLLEVKELEGLNHWTGSHP